MPLLNGTAPEEERSQNIAHVMEAGKTFSFDPSLMQAVEDSCASRMLVLIT